MLTDLQQMYGLIGYPLGHSFSQNYFNDKFKVENIPAKYVNFEIPTIDEFPEVVNQHPLLRGLNVTIPYKEQVMKYLDEIDDDAAAIGAVNVIKILRDSKGRISGLRGYNSDVIGFVDSIKDMLKPEHRKALVLGTGGAAKAVSHGLRSLGVTPVYVSRTKAEGRLTYAELTQEVMAEHTVVVNCTPVGMYPHIEECPDIPYECITPEHVCYDVLYNPDTTLFIKKCAERGANTKNGIEMLLMQAFAAWNIWQGR